MNSGTLSTTLLEPLSTHPVPLAPHAVLDYLAQRLLDSPAALTNRVNTAEVVLLGQVERLQFVENHDVASAPRGLIQVAELRAEQWLKGTPGGAAVKLVWIEAGGLAGPHAEIATGRAGVLFARKPAPADLARAFPEALAPDDSGGPALVPDPSGELARAVKWVARVSALPVAEQLRESQALLDRKGPYGPEVQAAYALLARRGTGSEQVLARGLGTGKESPQSLLRRAALVRAGQPELGLQGFDPAALDEATLSWFGLTPVLNGGQRVSLLGPPPQAAIREPAGS